MGKCAGTIASSIQNICQARDPWTCGGYSNRGRLLRLLPNGALDTTFGTNGIVSTGSSSSFYGIDIQGDGRVVFATSGGVYRMDEDGGGAHAGADGDRLLGEYGFVDQDGQRVG